MANNAPVEYGTSPVGRFIMGDPFNKQTKDQNGRDIPPDKQKFFFGIAVEKTAPGVNEMFGILQKAAMAGYANVPNVMQQIQMGLAAPAFSWKVQDGDEMVIDQQTGQQQLRNQYGAGCWIFKFSTTLPIRPAKYPPQSNIPIDCDASEIKRGYFVQVSYSTQMNGNLDHTAGIYVNPKTICLVGFGEEIVGGPSLEQQFAGAQTGYMPPGMTQTPQAPMGAPGAVNPGMPAAGAPMPQQTAPMAPVNQTPPPGMMPTAGTPMGNAAPQATPPGMPPAGMPGSGAPNPMNSGQTAMPGVSPSNPMNSGGAMPPNNMPSGATTSPSSQPPGYGGYMNPQQ